MPWAPFSSAHPTHTPRPQPGAKPPSPTPADLNGLVLSPWHPPSGRVMPREREAVARRWRCWLHALCAGETPTRFSADRCHSDQSPQLCLQQLKTVGGAGWRGDQGQACGAEVTGALPSPPIPAPVPDAPAASYGMEEGGQGEGGTRRPRMGGWGRGGGTAASCLGALPQRGPCPSLWF